MKADLVAAFLKPLSLLSSSPGASHPRLKTGGRRRGDRPGSTMKAFAAFASRVRVPTRVTPRSAFSR